MLQPCTTVIISLDYYSHNVSQCIAIYCSHALCTLSSTTSTETELRDKGFELGVNNLTYSEK